MTATRLMPNPPGQPQPSPYLLLPHPSFPPAAALHLTATVQRCNGGLCFGYTLSGSVAAVLLSQRNNPPAAEHGLWRHTCLEAFVAAPDTSAYHEFNFSPSGNWAAYAFAGPRKQMTDCSAVLQPVINTRKSAQEFALTATVTLPAALQSQGDALVVGLTAVLAHPQDRRTYWALAHPCDDPDFHARAGWLATLPPRQTL